MRRLSRARDVESMTTRGARQRDDDGPRAEAMPTRAALDTAGAVIVWVLCITPTPAHAGHTFQCEDPGGCTAFFWHRVGDPVCEGSGPTRRAAVAAACNACTPDGEDFCSKAAKVVISVESAAELPITGEIGYAYQCVDAGPTCTVVYWNRARERLCVAADADPVKALLAACAACDEAESRCAGWMARLVERTGSAPPGHQPDS